MYVYVSSTVCVTSASIDVCVCACVLVRQCIAVAGHRPSTSVVDCSESTVSALAQSRRDGSCLIQALLRWKMCVCVCAVCQILNDINCLPEYMTATFVSVCTRV